MPWVQSDVHVRAAEKGHVPSLARVNGDENWKLVYVYSFRAIFGRLCYFPIDRTSFRATMSTSTSRLNLGSIFDSAIQSYRSKTGNDITTHPLATELQSCHSPEAVLAVLRNQASAIGQSHDSIDSENFSKWLIPTVNVLYAFSATLGEGAGLVNRTNPLLSRKVS